MSLRTGILTLVDECGEEKELKPSGKIFRIGSYLSCDLVLENREARSVHCEIQSDSFGRITITNYSKSNPVRINDVPLRGTRPLYTGSVITIFEKNLKWINKHCLPRCRVDLDKIQTPKDGHKRTEQAPNSEPSILMRKKQASKRTTIHNLGSSKGLTDEEPGSGRNENDDDYRQQHLTRASMISAAKTFGATPPRSSKRTTNILARNIRDDCDLKKSKTDECKENTPVATVESKNLALLKCHSSGVVVTSYSPSATPTKTPNSFACVMSNKTTPKSAYGTPRSIMSDLNTDECSGSNKITPKTPGETCSMFLIDFTTPDVYRTPLQRRTPLFRSAIKNSATRTLSRVTEKTGEHNNTTITPASNKKIRWGSSNSTLMSSEGTPTPKNNDSSRNISSKKSTGNRCVVKSSSNRLNSYVTGTPASLTRQRSSTTSSAKSISNVSKVTPNLRRKSLNLSVPLKTPKAIFSVDRRASVNCSRGTPAKVDNTPNTVQPPVNTTNSTELCKPLKTLDRSSTFILDTPTLSIDETAAEESDSKAEDIDFEKEENVNDTFTFNDDNDSEARKQISEENLQNLTDESDVALKVSETDSSESNKELDSTESQAYPKRDDLPNLVGVKELLKTPKPGQRLDMKGIKELFNTPTRDDLTDVRGVKKLIKTPKPPTGKIELKGVKELFNTPARDDLSNVVGVKELMNTPKVGDGIEDPKGLKELFNTPKVTDGLSDAKGIRELFKTPMQKAGIDDVGGVKELFQTPKNTSGANDGKEIFKTPKDYRSMDETRSVEKLFHTPKHILEIGSAAGVREIFNNSTENNLPNASMKGILTTPKSISSELSAHASEILKTPCIPEYQGDDDLSGIFKSPGSREVMVLSTPKSIAVEKTSNMSSNLLKTPKEVNVLEDIEEIEEIFNSPVSNVIFSCTESGEKEDLSPEQQFDKLVGKPVARRTYGRTTLTPRVLPMPIADENQSSRIKTDIQEWLDNVESENKSENHKLQTKVDNEINSSPVVKMKRKPLATSSSIKPTRSTTKNANRLPKESDLNEVSGIEHLDDSFLSSVEYSEVHLPLDGNSVAGGTDEIISNTTQHASLKLNTPQKSVQPKNTKSSYALKVTPQIRRLRGKFSTPYSGKSSKREETKDPFADLPVQYIDESSINISDSKNSVDSVTKRDTSNKKDKKLPSKPMERDDTLDTSVANSTVDVDAEYLSTSEIAESRKSCKAPRKTITKSGAVIFISDDESNSHLKGHQSETTKNSFGDTLKVQETTHVSAQKTLEFVAMSDVSASSLNHDKSMSDAFKSLPIAVSPNQHADSNVHVAKVTENTIEESLVEDISILDSRQSVSYEEEEENLLNLYDTQLNSQKSECRTFEAVFVDSNSIVDTLATENSVELSNVERESGNQSNRRSKRSSAHMSYVSFAESSNTKTVRKSTSVEKEASSQRRDSVSMVDETTQDRSIPKSGLNTSNEFINFVENPTIGKHILGNSFTPQAAKTKSKIPKIRLTLGSAVESAPIDVAEEKIRHEFSNFNMNPVVRLARGLSQIHVNPRGLTVSRRTTGNVPLNPCFDLEAEQRRRDLSIDFENFQDSNAKRNLRGRTLSPAKYDKPEKSRRTMGQKPIIDQPFDYKLNICKKQSKTSAGGDSLDFENFIADKTISIDPKRRTLDVNTSTKKAVGKSRHSVGDLTDTSFNLTAEKERRNLSLDFQTFEMQPKSRRVRRRSEIVDVRTSAAVVNRRTMGGRPISKDFDLKLELERNNIERELARMDSTSRSLTHEPSHSGTPTKVHEVHNLPGKQLSAGRTNDKDNNLEGDNNLECSGNMCSEAIPSYSENIESSAAQELDVIVAAVENICESISQGEEPAFAENLAARSPRAANNLTAGNEATIQEDISNDKSENNENKSEVESDSNVKHVHFGENVYYEIGKNDLIANHGRPVARKRQRKVSAAYNSEIGPKPEKSRGRKRKTGRNVVNETAEGDSKSSGSAEVAETVNHKEASYVHDDNKENDGRITRRGRKVVSATNIHDDFELNKPAEHNKVSTVPPRVTRGNRRKAAATGQCEESTSDETSKTLDGNILQAVQNERIENENFISKNESHSENTETAPKVRSRRVKINQLENNLQQEGQDNDVDNATERADSSAGGTSVEDTDLVTVQAKNPLKRGRKQRKPKISKESEKLSADECSGELKEESPVLKSGIRKGRVMNVLRSHNELRSSPRINARTRKEKLSQDEAASDIENLNPLLKASQRTKNASGKMKLSEEEEKIEENDLEEMKEQKPAGRNLKRNLKSSLTETVVPRRTRKMLLTEKANEECKEDEAAGLEGYSVVDIKANSKLKARTDLKARVRNTRLKSTETETVTETEQNNIGLQARQVNSFSTPEEQSPSVVKPKGRAKRQIVKENTNERSSNTEIIPTERQDNAQSCENVEEIFKTPMEVKPKLRSARLKSTSDTPNKAESDNIILAKRTRRLVSTETLKTPEGTPEINNKSKSRITRLKSTDTLKEPDSPQIKHTKALQQEENQNSSKSEETHVENPIKPKARRGRKPAILNVATESVAPSPEKIEMIEEAKPKRGRKPKAIDAVAEIPSEHSTPTKGRGRGNKRKVECDVLEIDDVPKKTRSRRK